MTRVIFPLSIITALCVTSLQAVPTTYTGTLSVTGVGADGALLAGGAWNDPATTLAWTVDNTTTPGKWHYAYTLSVPTGAISHMIVEVSDGDPGPIFLLANLFDPQSAPAGWIDDPIELGEFIAGQQGGNPNMPENVYGVKFNAETGFDDTTVTVAFDSDRVPVWGDFYGKNGDPIDWPTYRRRYLAEMTTQKDRIFELAREVEAGKTITLLCSSACRDESRCHRTLLKQLLEKTATGSGRETGS